MGAMLLGINWDQFLSLSRDGLKLLGMYLIMRGVTDADTWNTVMGAVTTTAGGLMTLGGIAVSIYVHSTQKKIASVAEMPELQGPGMGIVTTPALARAIPLPNVVSQPAELQRPPENTGA